MTAHCTVGNPRIVVGVDGSAGSHGALRWAIAQARLTGATVDAVTVWQESAFDESGYGWAAPAADPDDETIMEHTLDGEASDAEAATGDPVNVVDRVLEGHPAQVLVEVAIEASLLVVGSRGRGAVAGALLGSVSQHCVRHASCPVVVVPG